MEHSVASRKQEIITTLAVLIVVVAIVAATSAMNKKKPIDSSSAANVAPNTSQTADPAPSTSSTNPTTQNTTPALSASTPSQTPTSSAPTYKDGSYTATGSYDSPGGEEQITVSVTLAGDVVTATSAKSGANDIDAQEYQSQFISGYKQQVVGKNVANISLSRVSGSSLTSQGFNDALAQIKQQAHA